MAGRIRPDLCATAAGKKYGRKKNMKAFLWRRYGARLTHGPPTDSGFFYDSYMGSEVITEADYKVPQSTITLQRCLQCD